MSLFYPDYTYKLTLKSADVTLVATRSSVDVAKFDVSVRRGNTTHHADLYLACRACVILH